MCAESRNVEALVSGAESGDCGRHGRDYTGENVETKTTTEQSRKLANVHFAGGGCGYRGRIAVLIAGDAHNFPRRNKRLASLQKQGPDNLRNAL